MKAMLSTGNIAFSTTVTGMEMLIRVQVTKIVPKTRDFGTPMAALQHIENPTIALVVSRKGFSYPQAAR